MDGDGDGNFDRIIILCDKKDRESLESLKLGGVKLIDLPLIETDDSLSKKYPASNSNQLNRAIIGASKMIRVMQENSNSLIIISSFEWLWIMIRGNMGPYGFSRKRGSSGAHHLFMDYLGRKGFLYRGIKCIVMRSHSIPQYIQNFQSHQAQQVKNDVEMEIEKITEGQEFQEVQESQDIFCPLFFYVPRISSNVIQIVGRTSSGERVHVKKEVCKSNPHVYVSFVEKVDPTKDSWLKAKVKQENYELYTEIKKRAIKCPKKESLRGKWIISDLGMISNIPNEKGDWGEEFSTTWALNRDCLNNRAILRAVENKKWDYRETGIEFWNTMNHTVEFMVSGCFRMAGGITDEEAHSCVKICHVSIKNDGISWIYSAMAGDDINELMSTTSDEQFYLFIEKADPDILVCMGILSAIRKGSIDPSRLTRISKGVNRAMLHLDNPTSLAPIHLNDLIADICISQGLSFQKNSEEVMGLVIKKVKLLDQQMGLSHSHLLKMKEIGLCSLGEVLSEPERFMRIYRNYMGSSSVTSITNRGVNEWMVSPVRNLMKESDLINPGDFNFSSGGEEEEGDENIDTESGEISYETSSVRKAKEVLGGEVIYDNNDKKVYDCVMVVDFMSHYGNIIKNQRISPDPVGIMSMYVSEQINRRNDLKETSELKREILKRLYNSISGCFWILFRILAKCMTQCGRQLILKAKDIVDSSKMGVVVYGDTDSLMISMNKGFEDCKEKLEFHLRSEINHFSGGGSRISTQSHYSRFAHVTGKLYFALEGNGMITCSSMIHHHKGFPSLFKPLIDRVLLNFMKNNQSQSQFLNESLSFCREVISSYSAGGLQCSIERKKSLPEDEKTILLSELLIRMVFRGEDIPSVGERVRFLHILDLDAHGVHIFETLDYFMIASKKRRIVINWRYYLERFFKSPLVSALDGRVDTIKSIMDDFVGSLVDTLTHKNTSSSKRIF